MAHTMVNNFNLFSLVLACCEGYWSRLF